MGWKHQISPRVRGREEGRRRKLSSDPVTNLETTGRRAGAASPGLGGPHAQADFIGAPNLLPREAGDPQTYRENPLHGLGSLSEVAGSA